MDLSKLADAGLREQLLSQLGGSDEAKEFLDVFEFHLDRESLHLAEDDLRHQFVSDGGREPDWYRLKFQLGKWVVHPDLPNPGGHIYLRDIKIAAGLRRLQRIPEDYTPPLDFVIPDERWHEELVRRIEGPRSDGFVIAGSAGSGKSTYLSFIFQDLADKGFTVLRHHYFLPGEADPSRRAFERVGQELMYQIEDQLPGELLDKLGSFGTSGSLSQWICSAARHLEQMGRKMVLIVDGLDHAYREEQQTSELDRLFEHLTPPPPGLTLIVGTQPVADRQLPRRLLAWAPRDRWLTIPKLTIKAIQSLLVFHADDFGFARDGEIHQSDLVRSAVCIEERTAGHPLIVRYLLRSLRISGGRCDPWAITHVVLSPDGEIKTYYALLWHSLSTMAQNLLSMIAVVEVPWTREWLIECLDPNGSQTLDFQSALQEVTHLLEVSDTQVRPPTH
ncbi:MAG: ATP-binding protein [Bryobacterales bacterium]|nr:ATP-binding protein [Bryobacterales bacterium]